MKKIKQLYKKEMRLKSYLLVNLCMYTHLLWIYLRNKQKGGLAHKPNGKFNKIESNQPYLLWLFLNPSKDEYTVYTIYLFIIKYF